MYGATNGDVELEEKRKRPAPAQEDFDGDHLLRLSDLPAVGMPWFFFALVLIPSALADDQLLSTISVACTLLLSVGFLMLSKGTAWRILSFICLLFTAMGFYLGRYDRGKYVAEYGIYKRAPHFSDVVATENPGAYQDAGSLDFTVDTRIDTARGLGYSNDGVWCVAPIISGDGPVDSVGFWAVGENCCRQRGHFSCAAGTNESLREGTVVLDTRHIHNSDIEQYRTAAQMAAAAYSVYLPADPVFVKWGITPREALREELSAAFTFALFALFASLLVIPVFVVLMSVAGLSLTRGISKREDDHPVVRDMTFGFDLFSERTYSQQLQVDLLNHRHYWSGEVLYDYAFHLANKHLFLGPFICHPVHPFAKWERATVLAIIVLLLIFPVAAFSVRLGDGMARTLLVCVCATLPRNLLKIYLINVAQQENELELEGGHNSRSDEMIREAATYEYVVLAVCIAVTIVVCVLCSNDIRSRTEKPLLQVLGANCDGLVYAFSLEILFDLFMPFFGEGRYSQQMTLGFFGRWCWERDDFTSPQWPKGTQDNELQETHYAQKAQDDIYGKDKRTQFSRLPSSKKSTKSKSGRSGGAFALLGQAR